MNVANLTRRCSERDFDVVSRSMSEDLVIKSQTASPKLGSSQEDMDDIGEKGCVNAYSKSSFRNCNPGSTIPALVAVNSLSGMVSGSNSESRLRSTLAFGDNAW